MYYNDKPARAKTAFQQNYCTDVEIQLKGSTRKETFQNVTLRVYNDPPRIEVKTRQNSVYTYNMDSVLSYYMALEDRDFNVERGLPYDNGV